MKEKKSLAEWYIIIEVLIVIIVVCYYNNRDHAAWKIKNRIQDRESQGNSRFIWNGRDSILLSAVLL
jgi:hypothetical protein